jgi:lipoprotein NlpD
MTPIFRSAGVVVGLSMAVWLVGCSSRPPYRVPVEDRLPPTVRPVAPADPRTQAVRQPPGFENAGKAGYYTVKPGDTLIRIGLDHGQSYRDISRWNNLENPNRIEVGQVLRVVPPTSSTAVAMARPTAPTPAANQPAAAPAASNTSSPATSPAGTTNSTTGAVSTAPAAQPTAAPASSTATTTSNDATATSTSPNDEDVGWIWPSRGPILAGFDDPKNKGIDIGGNAGDPVLAAGDGKVVYAGAGLRGYGNLVILKHNATYLTAYAHNQSLAVKEDQTVKKGQKIAEMGSSDADRVKLHFEVRRQGRPVDPMKYLPAR